jgi:hypothetical protein
VTRVTKADLVEVPFQPLAPWAFGEVVVAAPGWRAAERNRRLIALF